MGTISDVAIKYSKGRMIRQQPEGHNTFPTHQKTSELLLYKVLRLFSSGAIGAIRTRDPLLRSMAYHLIHGSLT